MRVEYDTVWAASDLHAPQGNSSQHPQSNRNIQGTHPLPLGSPCRDAHVHVPLSVRAHDGHTMYTPASQLTRHFQPKAFHMRKSLMRRGWPCVGGGVAWTPVLDGCVLHTSCASGVRRLGEPGGAGSGPSSQQNHRSLFFRVLPRVVSRVVSNGVFWSCATRGECLGGCGASLDDGADEVGEPVRRATRCLSRQKMVAPPPHSRIVQTDRKVGWD